MMLLHFPVEILLNIIDHLGSEALYAFAKTNKDIANVCIKRLHHLALKNGKTLLHIIAQKGDTQFLALVLSQSEMIDFSTKDKRGRTPLLMAVAEGHVKVVRLLLEAGTPTDRKALRYSSRYNKKEVYLTLLKYPKFVKDEENILSSTQARWEDKGGDIIRFLLRNFDPTAIGPQGTTPLHEAVQLALLNTLEQYLQAPLLGNLSAQDWQGKTALHYATYFLPEKVGRLIEAGIDVHIRNREGQNALDEARNNGCSVKDIRLLICHTEGKEALEVAEEQEADLPIHNITEGHKIDKRIKRLFKAKTGNHGRIKSYNEPLWLNRIEPRDQVVALAIWLKGRRARVEVNFRSGHCRAWWPSPEAQNKVILVFLRPGDTASGLGTLKIKYIQ